MLKYDIRMVTSGAGYVKARIGTTTSGGEIGSNGGGGANTAIRMLAEQIAHEGLFNNIHLSPGWVLDMHL